MLNSGVIAIDNGGNSTCVRTATTCDWFPSARSHFGNRNMLETPSEKDFVVEYKGKKRVMGEIAEFDSTLIEECHDKTKANEYFELSIMVAIHKYGFSANYLVVDVPINIHNKEEKEAIIERLKGEHVITVNGITKSFKIMDVRVAPETAVAFWVNKPKGKSRFLDLGSRTIGYATTYNDGKIVRFIDSESGTFNDAGLAIQKDYEFLADYLLGKLTSMWDKNDKIYLLGGGALEEELVNALKQRFPNLEVMENPKTVNAEGMYNLGCKLYELS